MRNTHLRIDSVRDQIAHHHQHFLVDLSNGVRNLQTASAEHTVASAGPMGCMGTGQWAAGTVRLWRWHSAERGKYQLKQHFEGARLPHVAADRSSILTVHALNQFGQLPGSNSAVVHLLGLETTEGLIERVEERQRLKRDRRRQLCRTLHRCRLAVVILAAVLIVFTVTSRERCHHGIHVRH